MISSVLGAVIMSMATVAMLISIDLSDKVLNQAGKHPLTEAEKKIVRRISAIDSTHMSDLETQIQRLELPSD